MIRRDTCPKCQQSIPITTRGRIRSHTGMGRLVCPGGGTKVAVGIYSPRPEGTIKASRIDEVLSIHNRQRNQSEMSYQRGLSKGPNLSKVQRDITASFYPCRYGEEEEDSFNPENTAHWIDAMLTREYQNFKGYLWLQYCYMRHCLVTGKVEAIHKDRCKRTMEFFLARMKELEASGA